MNSLTNTATIKDAIANIELDNDCPEVSDEQFNIMRLVLSHKGVRGNSKVSLYYQGMEETRLNSLKSIMNNMNMTLVQAMKVLDIPNEEYKKYASVIKTI